MKKNPYDVFINLCKKDFLFLEKKFNCEFIINKSTGTNNLVLYKNSTTGVTIKFDPREGGILINLYRLINNEIPVYSLDNGYIIEDIIFVQTHDANIYKENIGIPINEDTLQNTIKRYAELVEKYARDILKGNFGSFPNLEILVKNRQKEYNEKFNKTCGGGL